MYLQLDFFPPLPSSRPRPPSSVTWTSAEPPNWSSCLLTCLPTFFAPQAPLEAHHTTLRGKILQGLPITLRIHDQILTDPWLPLQLYPQQLLCLVIGLQLCRLPHRENGSASPFASTCHDLPSDFHLAPSHVFCPLISVVFPDNSS